MLTTAKSTALPPEVLEKNRVEAEQTLFPNLYLCLGGRGQDKLHDRKPHLDLTTTSYPRILDEFEESLRKRIMRRLKRTKFCRENSGKGSPLDNFILY